MKVQRMKEDEGVEVEEVCRRVDDEGVEDEEVG